MPAPTTMPTIRAIASATCSVGLGAAVRGTSGSPEDWWSLCLIVKSKIDHPRECKKAVWSLF
jgi:hypothetical protein